MMRALAWGMSLLVGCAAVAAPQAPWTGPALSGHASADKLSSPRKIRLLDRNVVQVESCDDVVRFDTRIDEEASGTNIGAKSFQSQRVACQALDAVKQMQPAGSSRLPSVRTGPEFAEALKAIAPAGFFLAISDDAQAQADQADAAGKTLQQFRPDTRFEAGADHHVLISEGGLRQDVTLLARGDLDGDGLEDWLLRIDSSLDKGTYGDSHLWLLTRTRDSGPLQVLKRWP